MKKTEVIHELFEICKEIDFDDTHIMIENAKSKEEKDFIRLVTNYILQQKQKEVIAEKRF